MRRSDQQVRRLVVAILAVGVVAGSAVLAGLAALLVEMHEPPSVRLVVVDTDAGPDDAFAILEILRGEEMNVTNSCSGTPCATRLVAVTCVQGNTNVSNVQKNVFATLDIAKRLDIPVFSGASAPLLPPGTTYTKYFGEDGFGDFLPPGPPIGQLQQEHAAVALVRLAKENAGALSLVCIGPLTNVALAIRLDPNFLDNLQNLYILGGVAHGNGNMSPGAEFNIWTDADAALVVFDAIAADKPAFVLPWETVLDAEMPMTWRRDVLGSAGSPSMLFLNLAERLALKEEGLSWSMADGLLAAHLLDGRVAVPTSAVRLTVLGGTSAARGVTLVDHSNTTGLPANVILIENPNISTFQRLLLKLLTSS